jgi:hypothetical protein
LLLLQLPSLLLLAHVVKQSPMLLVHVPQPQRSSQDTLRLPHALPQSLMLLVHAPQRQLLSQDMLLLLHALKQSPMLLLHVLLPQLLLRQLAVLLLLDMLCNLFYFHLFISIIWLLVNQSTMSTSV